MAGRVEEEVIADSEGEDDLLNLPPAAPDTSILTFYQPSERSMYDMPHPTGVSNISTFSTIRPATVSEIATSTNGGRSNNSASSSRPSDPILTASLTTTTPLPISSVTSTEPPKKERPKPRPIKRKPPVAVSPNAVESLARVEPVLPKMSLPEETDDLSYGADISERAKTRRRAVKAVAASVAIDTPPLTSPKRKRTAPRKAPPMNSLGVIELSDDDEDELSLQPPTSKRPKATQKKKKATSPARTSPVRTFNDAQSSQPSIPVPSSSLPMHRPTSPLPPSDLPPSPLTDPEPEFPPIAALSEPNSFALDDRADEQLFSPPPITRKRKRGVTIPDDSDGPEPFLPPPPSTFFAVSSSPPHPSADLPTARMASDPTSKGTKEPKTTKKKQKEVQSDPLPEPPKKSKGKGKKINKNVVETDDGTQITVQKQRAKGKKKDIAPPPKSREFIEDDADEPHVDAPAALPTGDLDGRTNQASSSRSHGRQRTGETSVYVEVDLPKPATSNVKRKGKKVILDDDEDDFQMKEPTSLTEVSEENPPRVPASPKQSKSTKENSIPDVPKSQPIPLPSTVEPKSTRPSISSRYSIAPRTKPTPMSELIKRVNSLPGSPFAASPAARSGVAYSPYLKSSRSMLSRIAPLHPNRRTPPPPPPPPPPKKKSKKEIEREEKWEEELIESLGGLDAWVALSDVDRKELRRNKFDMEMNGWD
ncbi:hypothetical protein ONZ45_g1475 [Pleurotus djamor]|nr:hypothetical protein ONZ45_g1475 [Pleurotus djamor]